MSFGILLLVLVLVAAAVIVGAYSHKWLQQVTGAPSKITPAVVKANIAADIAVVKADGAKALAEVQSKV